MERQFTSTAYIIEDERVLLIYHRKLSKWLPPGGHIDPNETPPDAAIREAFEETGMEIELMLQENIWIDRINATSFARPYLCLLENIPEHKGIAAHQHMDFIYIAKPIGGTLKQNLIETDGIKWFTRDEIELLEPDVEIFVETKLTIDKILNKAHQVTHG